MRPQIAMFEAQKDHDFRIISDTPAEMLVDDFQEIDPPGPDTPLTPFPSDLRLTREREKWLVERAIARHQALDAELGLSCTGLGTDGTPVMYQLTGQGRDRATQSFFAKRQRFGFIAENDMSWRPAANPGSIYAYSNLAVPLCRRIANAMSAKAIRAFFATEPYFACYPVGLEDDTLADTLQQAADVKIATSGSDAVLREAIENSFIYGESVLKVTEENDRTFFRKTMLVAVDPEGKPLIALDGKPIGKGEAIWIPAADNPAIFVLKRDGRTPRPASPLTFASVLMEQENIHYTGPRTHLLYFRDFLCPLNAPDVQKADCCVHLYPMSVSALAATYMRQPGPGMESLRTALESLRTALRSPKEWRAGTALRPELGESVAPEAADPMMLIGEFYIRCDADGDGIEEDICLIMDMDTSTPIFYDYVDNVTATGRRPFHVVRSRRVANRWYGQGAIEQFEPYQQTIDLMVNRRNRNQSEAGRITAFHHHYTVEYQNDPNFRMNWGRTVTPIEGKTLDDVVQTVYLEDNKYDKLTEEIQFWLQFALNESGVQTANDAGMAGMETTKLATGVRNVEKTSNELFGIRIANLKTGLEGAIDDFVTTLFAGITEEEALTFTGKGEAPAELTLTRRDVQGLSLNVRVLLTNLRDEQILASNQQANALVQSYYSLPPPLQALLQKMYQDQLKALQIPGAENYITPQQFSIGGAPIPNATPPPGDSTIVQPNL